MPSLLAIIYMESLGPQGWIQSDETSQLNSYLYLQKNKKGVIRENVTHTYLEKFYLALR